ncbi:response regulator receiver protein PatA [Calothrix sp. PCC 7716]|nr:response regulator receiver protein PatA [Calothrix sp. PCC 7716]
MKTVNIGRQKFLHNKELTLLLEEVSHNSIKGCLQVLSLSQTWSLYFDKGQLIYAYQANSMWDIFSEKLQQLFPQLNNLDNELGGQLKAIFDSKTDDAILDRPDYLAICWLVEQQYLNSLQAGKLIEEMAIRMLDSFLKLGDGAYEFIPQTLPDYLPKFCHLDISLLIRRRQLRSMNLTNVNLFKESANRSEIKLFLDLEQKHLKSNLINDITVTTENIEDSTVKINQLNDSDTEQKPYKVLCIDDSPTMLKTIKSLLDEQIFTVISIDDPLKGLMQILRIKPDIILLDVSMPNLDGYQLCSLLRKHSDFRNTPVVMVTGKTGFLDKARAKMVKASGYLSKPFSKADLLKVLFSQIGHM